MMCKSTIVVTALLGAYIAIAGPASSAKLGKQPSVLALRMSLYAAPLISWALLMKIALLVSCASLCINSFLYEERSSLIDD